MEGQVGLGTAIKASAEDRYVADVAVVDRSSRYT